MRLAEDQASSLSEMLARVEWVQREEAERGEAAKAGAEALKARVMRLQIEFLKGGGQCRSRPGRGDAIAGRGDRASRASSAEKKP